MKKLLYILIAILLVGACSGSRYSKEWCHDCPKIDSLMNQFSLAFANGVSDDSLQKITDQIEILHSQNQKREEISALLHYAKARRKARIGNDSAWNEICLALSLSDSVRYPYTHIRIRNLFSIIRYHKIYNIKALYIDLKNYIEYYSRIGDTLALAETLTNLSLIFSDTDDKENDSLYTNQAQELFKKLKVYNYVLKNSLNIARTKAVLGDTLGASLLLDSILSIKESYQDRKFLNELLLSRWKIMRDTTSLNERIHQIRTSGEISNKGNYMVAEKSLTFLPRFMLDSALYYARLSLRGIEKIDNLEALTTIYSANTEAWSLIGNADSALYYLKLKDELTPYRIANENANKLRSLKAKTAIIEADAKVESIRQANKSRLIITILSSLSLILIIVFLLQRRIAQAKIREEKARTEAEQKNRQLAISACALQEKENVIETMRQIINRNKEEGKLSTSAAHELNTSINIYLDNNEEWDNLNMLNSSIHPDFAEEMKRLYPDISDSKLQLAICIVAGLTTKQIARLMKIQPDSVKKARWKLRTMMALPTESSLEKALSDIHKQLSL